MDFLDVLELETIHKKSNRVRSWYLYEQYKSLEKNPLFAALRMKEKSQQEKILSQELSERRARRRICDDYQLIDSDLVLDSSKDAMNLHNYDIPCNKCSHHSEDNSTTLSWQSASLDHNPYDTELLSEQFTTNCSLEGATDDVFFDSPLERSVRFTDEDFDNTSQSRGAKFEDFVERTFHPSAGLVDDDFDNTKYERSVKTTDETEELTDEDFNAKYIDELEINEEDFETPNVQSKEKHSDDHIDNKTPTQHNDDINLKKELESVCQKTEDINLQLENAKENILCLENLAKLCEEDKISDDWSSDATETNDMLSKYYAVDQVATGPDNGLFLLWSKLVSYAYQIIRVSHGNCYYDYSSQLLTAILACDILRRGISKMCDVLQPYVCPIKFVDENKVTEIKKRKIRKSKTVSEHYRPIVNDFKDNYRKIYVPESQKTYRNTTNPHSDCIKYNDILKKCTQRRRSSEPCKSSLIVHQVPSEESNYIIRRAAYKRTPSKCHCNCRKKIINPMLKLSRCIDVLINDAMLELYQQSNKND